MFATFFPANHPVGEMMDHLQKTTHFGPGGRPRGYQMTSAVLEEPVWDNPFLSGLRSRIEGLAFLTEQQRGWVHALDAEQLGVLLQQNADALLGELADDVAHVRQRELLIRAVGEGATPGIEDHHGLRTGGDLARARAVGYDAFLIGEWLLSQPDPGTALATMLQEARAMKRARSEAY